MSNLFMVATPIGNLEDITLRAIRILKEVDVIACEDTRHTKKLLNHLGISTRVIACHAKNEEQSAKGIIMLLEEEKDIAYVSDAGTPGISDPGTRLVHAVRDAGFTVIPVPGVSALSAICSVAGYTGSTIVFDGFLSPKSGRRKNRLQQLLERNEAFVLYESPYRIVKLLEALADLAPERRTIVGRELTKMYEEIIEDSALGLYENYSQRQSIKGEFTLLVSPADKKKSSENSSKGNPSKGEPGR
ncbi:MAG: 16S rRNA (cytidine(1402)-2'-O)-methyltransferase [Spirochaetales bacterium]|nr:16S rRNA (cytidine(1402)-2'-O)-methyltransferase [Spirochaetales bacterium]